MTDTTNTGSASTTTNTTLQTTGAGSSSGVSTASSTTTTAATSNQTSPDESTSSSAAASTASSTTNTSSPSTDMSDSAATSSSATSTATTSSIESTTVGDATSSAESVSDSSATTDPQGSGACASADILCADFEAVSAGSLPAAAPWVTAPEHCANTDYEIGVAAGSGVDGSQALVSSHASSSNNACALVADLGTPTDFWVQAQVKYMGAGPTNEHEITFFELGEHPDQDDPEGRVGFRTDGCNASSGAAFPGLEFNMTKGPGGEFTGCTGVALEGDRWYCVEIHVVQSGSPTSGELYLDGEKQSFTNHGMPVEEVLADGKFRYLKLGAQTYGSIGTGPLLLDDVAVSTVRIGCP